jgi:hypothetical protein
VEVDVLRFIKKTKLGKKRETVEFQKKELHLEEKQPELSSRMRT